MLGMLLDWLGRSKAAVPHLKSGMGLKAGSTDWHIAAETLCVAYFNLNTPKPAEPVLKSILKHSPRNAKAWHRLGLVYEFTRRLALAEKAQRKAKRLGSRAAKAALRRVSSKRGARQEALGEYRCPRALQALVANGWWICPKTEGAMSVESLAMLRLPTLQADEPTPTWCIAKKIKGAVF
jgi:tetratricopeptide (TPR) repeat protein